MSSLKSDYNDQPGISQSQLENKELTWETNYNFNSGLDVGLFNNRLNVTFEYYVRTTKNLLYSRPLSLSTGFSSYLANIGKRRNQGCDQTSIERFAIGREISMADYTTTRRLHSGDYVRLKNITLGITLPKKLTRKVGIDRVRVYGSGSNLLTWAAYDYIDPESGSSPSWETPPMKTFTFGLEVKF